MTSTEMVVPGVRRSGEDTLTLRWPIHARIRYSLTALRLGSHGAIRGPVSQPVDTGLTVEAEVAITARWRTEITPEQDGSTRLRRYLTAGASTNAFPVVEVQAQCRGNLEEALSAIRECAGQTVKFPWRRGAELLLAGTSKALEKSLIAATWAAVHAASGKTPFLELVVERNAPVRVVHDALGGLSAEEATVELHLPFTDRKKSAGADPKLHWKAITEPARLFLHESSSVAPYEAANRYQAVLAVAGALVSRRPAGSPCAISFRDTRVFPARQALFSLVPLMDTHNLGDAGRRWLALAAAAPETEVEVAWCLQAAPSAAGAWLDVPAEKTAEFFRLLTEVSQAVQRTMRAWLPYVFFHRLERFNQQDVALPLLAYSASAPSKPRGRNEYTYDAMDENSVRRALWHIPEVFQDTLARVHATLVSAGCASAAAAYAPWKGERILARMKRSPHDFRTLLAMDEHFVEALIRFALAGCEIGSRLRAGGEDPLPRTSGMATAFARSVQAKLSSLYGGADFACLPSLLLVEGTCALYSAVRGTPLRPAATLRLRRLDNGREAVFAAAGRNPGQE